MNLKLYNGGVKKKTRGVIEVSVVVDASAPNFVLSSLYKQPKS